MSRISKYATKPAPKINRREMMLGEPKIRPLSVRYATPPPRADLCWLETAHFMPTDNATVLLAWPFVSGFTFRTGRFHAGKWWLSDDTEPRKKPVFFADLNAP